jgi:small subunit ribosomal protein S4
MGSKKSKCKICRRLGIKLFLKGERCFLPKCAMIKRAYPPGERRKKRVKALSEYGKELREKQKLKNLYNLRERQFKNYVKEVLEKRKKTEEVGDLLIRKLEMRLDNIVYRLGFASSRAQARKLVNHGHFLLNNKKVNLPSYQVKKGDEIKISEKSLKKTIFKNLPIILKNYQPPSWLSLDKEKLKGKVKDLPNLKEVSPPVEISAVFEYYSR